jgi:hypothetical protein
MKRGFEHKVVEYNSDNYERYWYKWKIKNLMQQTQ